jgi:hypothetical protein
MTINFSFFENEAKLDEPLGSVSISEGNQSLHVENVFLDAFFSALVTAFSRLSHVRVVSTEVEGEREFLRLERLDNQLRIGYDTQEITIFDVNEFGTRLRQACTQLLASFGRDTSENQMLAEVRAFASPSS